VLHYHPRPAADHEAAAGFSATKTAKTERAWASVRQIAGVSKVCPGAPHSQLLVRRKTSRRPLMRHLVEQGTGAPAGGFDQLIGGNDQASFF
jgi:hypothetical protein